MKRIILSLACAAAAASCSDSTQPRVATTIVLSPTSVRLDAVGGTQAITATVEDQHGQAISTAAVTWTSSAASAAVTPGTPSSGATITALTSGVGLVTASSGTAQTSVVVDIEQVPTTMVKTSGDAQVAVVSTPLSAPIQVELTDRLGSPVAGQIVTFTVTGGTGTVAQSSAVTAANGIAAANWTLGSNTGTQSLTASNATAGSATFTATAIKATGATASITATAGDNQAAMAGTSVATAPAVQVRDALGNVVVGAAVTFAVASGGGSLTGATATTNASGVATLGSWTLGTTADQNTLSVTSPSVNVVGTITAAGCSGGGAGTTGFAITLCYMTPMTTTQQAAFQAAATRWGTIITADLPDVTVPGGITAGECGSTFSGMPSPSFNFTIDDLLIFAAIDPIDGVGNILGQSSPCFIRSSSNLSFLGLMEFDSADIASLQASGQLNSVILHEMAHVLGFGTLWTNFNLLHNPVTGSTVGTTLDTYFSGTNALLGFNNIGGATYTGGQKVPVENNPSYGAGTYNSHWRESVLANELMTGFINNGVNPLSELTIRSMADMGYTVNPAAADPFFLTLSALRASAVGGTDTQALDLRNDNKALPIYSVDVFGRRVRIR